jgi:hypothetical protein
MDNIVQRQHCVTLVKVEALIVLHDYEPMQHENQRVAARQTVKIIKLTLPE